MGMCVGEGDDEPTNKTFDRRSDEDDARILVTSVKGNRNGYDVATGWENLAGRLTIPYQPTRVSAV